MASPSLLAQSAINCGGHIRAEKHRERWLRGRSETARAVDGHAHAGDRLLPGVAQTTRRKPWFLRLRPAAWWPNMRATARLIRGGHLGKGGPQPERKRAADPPQSPLESNGLSAVNGARRGGRARGLARAANLGGRNRGLRRVAASGAGGAPEAVADLVAAEVIQRLRRGERDPVARLLVRVSALRANEELAGAVNAAAGGATTTLAKTPATTVRTGARFTSGGYPRSAIPVDSAATIVGKEDRDGGKVLVNLTGGRMRDHRHRAPRCI